MVIVDALHAHRSRASLAEILYYLIRVFGAWNAIDIIETLIRVDEIEEFDVFRTLFNRLLLDLLATAGTFGRVLNVEHRVDAFLTKSVAALVQHRRLPVQDVKP